MNVFELEGSISLDVNSFKKAVSDAKQQGQDLGKSFTDQSAAILDLQKEIGRLSTDLTAAKSEISRLKSELDKAAKSADSNADSTSKMAKEAENASDAIDDEAKATEKSSDVNEALKDILERVSKSLDNMADVMSEVGKEEDTTAKKTDDYKDSVRKAKDETSLFEKAARSLGEAAKDTAGKIGDLAGKVGDVLVGAAKAGAAAVGAASTAVIALTKASVEGYGEYEQLVGGAQKIFDEMDYTKIAEDAANAYKDLNLSASEYLESINLAGATFAQTMGDEKGYSTVRKGMLAIADYASGTGKSITELNTKYQMITRAASSYQSIADQFSGVLPATSADFLEQAQAAGLLSETYGKLTEVPVAEYQQAVTDMLAKGVEDLGLSMNTVRESTETLTGSMAMTKAAWKNLVVGFADPDADIGKLISKFTESAKASFSNIMPTVIQALGGIGEFIEQIAPEISAALPEIIESTLPSLLSAGTSIVTSLVSAVTKSIPTLVPMAKQLLVSIKNAIVKNAPVVIGGFSDLLRKGVDWLAKNLPNIIAASKEIVSAIGQGISDNIGEIWDSLQDLGQLLWDNVIKPAWDFVTQELPNYINTSLKLIDFYSVGSAISSAITEGLKGLGDFISQIDWEQVGKDIARFINGINFSEIAHALAGLFGDALKALPDLLTGILSELDFNNFMDSLALIFVPLMLGQIKEKLETSEMWQKIGNVINEKMGGTDGKGGLGASAGSTFLMALEAFWVGWQIGTEIYDHFEEEINGVLFPIFDKIKDAWNRIFEIDLNVQQNGDSFIISRTSKPISTFDNSYDSSAYNELAQKWGAYDDDYFEKWYGMTKEEYLRAAAKAKTEQSRANASKLAGATRAGLLGLNEFYNAHAAGGIMINSPVLTTSGDLFGEAGREAILPLDQNTGWMDELANRLGGSSGIVIQNLNINMDGMKIASDYDTERFVELLSERLQALSTLQARQVGGVGW